MLAEMATDRKFREHWEGLRAAAASHQVLYLEWQLTAKVSQMENSKKEEKIWEETSPELGPSALGRETCLTGDRAGRAGGGSVIGMEDWEL